MFRRIIFYKIFFLQRARVFGGKRPEAIGLMGKRPVMGLGCWEEVTARLIH